MGPELGKGYTGGKEIKFSKGSNCFERVSDRRNTSVNKRPSMIKFSSWILNQIVICKVRTVQSSDGTPKWSYLRRFHRDPLIHLLTDLGLGPLES